MVSFRLQNPPPIKAIKHIAKRVDERLVTKNEGLAVLNWIRKQPTVPEGFWYKKFNSFVIVGRDGIVTSVLDNNTKIKNSVYGKEIF